MVEGEDIIWLVRNRLYEGHEARLFWFAKPEPAQIIPNKAISTLSTKELHAFSGMYY